MLLQGKNAIVTGARTGIGKAIVYKFAQEGANVWAVVHREDREWLEEMQMLGMVHNVWVKPVYIDLSDESAIASGIKSIIQEKLPIDVLVNAAGVVSPNRLIQMTPLSEMHRVMQVNFFAAIQICQLVSRVMCRQKSGSIINIASVAADMVEFGQLEYDASKAALIVATKKMAKEWGKLSVRVNAISPGVTDTKMIDTMDENLRQRILDNVSLRHIGQASNIAAVVAFLASDASMYVTGQNYKVDGGL